MSNRRLTADYDFVCIAEIGVFRDEDAFAGGEAVGHLIVARVLPPYGYIPACGLGAVGIQHIDPAASGVAEKLPARNHHTLCGFAKAEIHVACLPHADAFRLCVGEGEVNLELPLCHLGINLGDRHIEFPALALHLTGQAGVHAVDVMLVDERRDFEIVEDVDLSHLLAGRDALADLGGEIAELSAMRGADVEIVGPLAHQQ